MIRSCVYLINTSDPSRKDLAGYTYQKLALSDLLLNSLCGRQSGSMELGETQDNGWGALFGLKHLLGGVAILGTRCLSLLQVGFSLASSKT